MHLKRSRQNTLNVHKPIQNYFVEINLKNLDDTKWTLIFFYKTKQ